MPRMLTLAGATAGQALCERCKNETHRAKMFSMHEVMSLSERLRKACKQVSDPLPLQRRCSVLTDRPWDVGKGAQALGRYRGPLC